jgi:uncharacterized protein YllA (UPF0747 family)
VPLANWTPTHPAAIAWAAGSFPLPPSRHTPPPRAAALAAALATANQRWGNPVDDELRRWQAGATVVVTGQQPGLLGGPLLTLVKTAAVAAEVRRLREGGRDAVGFLWLATGDDDLPEVGWARVALGEELVELREPGWERGGALAGRVQLSSACGEWLASLRPRLAPGHAQMAAELAAECYGAGVSLGEATARFLGRLLAGTGVVLVDALEPTLAVAGAPATEAILERLPAVWAALEDGSAAMQQQGWPLPVRLSRQKLPVFRRVGERREGVPAGSGGASAALLAEHRQHSERFLPNVWLRPLLADAALGTATAILGGAELAYHLQGAQLWELAGVPRPDWRLRPHVTVVTAAERRMAAQLGVQPEHVLRPRPPAHALPGGRTRRSLAAARVALERRLASVASSAHDELPSLSGDVAATVHKLETSLGWLEGRLDLAAARDAEVEMGRWRRLRAFLRPDGKPQERYLSVLAPVLRLGLEWPRQLAEVIDPTHSGMHLLCWEEGGEW